ncbi:amino acid aldolase [Paludifilum halophilum]|uniref:Amino acid aldolase n=1 Tax=Paludifilum halophilum TaxID=1642702 RepID=A0A235BD46_9BACL|nr:amino acid aldolase [Paludifilum halophilum]
MRRDYDYYRNSFKNIPKPFAYLDLDLLQENIRKIRKRNNGKKIRIATKSLRCVQSIRYILKQGDPFQGVMCFTIPEALFLAERGLADLLVAYPAWDKNQIRATARAVRKGNSVTLMVDNPQHVDHIESIARREESHIPLCVDLDLSVRYPGLVFGVRRSPIRGEKEMLHLVQRIAASHHVHLDGLMGYEAQIAGVGDHYPRQWLKNTLLRFLKGRSVREIAERRAKTVQAIRRLGIPLRFINGGGTGSLHTTSLEDTVTEVTVGSGFYAPGLFDYYRDVRYRPAAGFAIEITRRPQPGIFTCTGGGYTASGRAGPDRLPLPYLPDGASLFPSEGAGEVQTPIRYRGAVELNLGDPVFMRHSKAGELCEHFNHLYWLSEGRIVDRVKTYRGHGRCFL